MTARGNERKAIFRTEADRRHFLALLGTLAERLGVLVHAYVLMDNHFHLLLETPEANLSRAMQWLGVSYSQWFNRRHRRVGHLFQGRFQAVIVEDNAGWQEVARYVHLNPVRVGALELGKGQRAVSRAGLAAPPSPALVGERSRQLREYPWSSYRGYAGYGAAPAWVCPEPLARLCGGRKDAERRQALREYTEQAVRQGAVERPWDRLVAGLVLGTATFARNLRRSVVGNPREQSQLQRLVPPVSWARIIAVVEPAKRERWREFSGRHGDWGRDAALWLGRGTGRLSLAQLGELAGGMDYAAVGQAVSRFDKRLLKEPALRRQMNHLKAQLSNVETWP